MKYEGIALLLGRRAQRALQVHEAKVRARLATVDGELARLKGLPRKTITGIQTEATLEATLAQACALLEAGAELPAEIAAAIPPGVLAIIPAHYNK